MSDEELLAELKIIEDIEKHRELTQVERGVKYNIEAILDERS